MPSQYKTCFFIGHREATDKLFPALLVEVERHVVEYGVGEFVVGHYGGFDAQAARAVKAAKEHHPDILLTRLLPYHPAERSVELPPYFDGSFYPPLESVPRRLAIVRANRWMIDHSNYLISFVWHPASNSRELLAYAQMRERQGGLHITNLPRP